MGLDISFTAGSGEICTHCGGVIKGADVRCEDSGGRGSYPILENIGYYVPYEKRPEENHWYGKDMVLTEDQAQMLLAFVKKHKDLYNRDAVLGLIATAIVDNCAVVINADW